MPYRLILAVGFEKGFEIAVILVFIENHQLTGYFFHDITFFCHRDVAEILNTVQNLLKSYEHTIPPVWNMNRTELMYVGGG